MGGNDGRETDLLSQHRTRNEEVLRILKREGVDIAQARRVDVFFWCPSRLKAEALAAQLTKTGYGEVLVGQSSTDQMWGAQASRFVSPAEVALDVFTAEMIQLALTHESEYDGWGVRH